MKKKLKFTIVATIFFAVALFAVANKPIYLKKIISYEVSPKDIALYLKDENGEYINNFANLLAYAKRFKKRVVFAMNGGMYLEDFSPQGLFVQNGKLIKKINKKSSDYGNFYMKPNGIFYITKQNRAHILPTEKFYFSKKIRCATQSGPMLLIDGKIHHRFKKDSKSLHLRNGVGVLPSGKLLFAISEKPINFYSFATFFKKHGCKNALYLDGSISRIYLPSQNITEQDALFGVIIAEIR